MSRANSRGNAPPTAATDVIPLRYELLTYSSDLSAISHKEEISGYGGMPDSLTNSVSLPPSLSQFDDPLDWSPARKVFVTWLSCSTTFVTTYTPGAYAAGLPGYKSMWGVGDLAVYAGVTLFTLLFAIAPMFLASLSELVGRRPLFLAAGVVYVISQIGSAVTVSFAGLLVTRALAGISCSVFSTVVGGVMSDIYVSKERNTAMAIFTGAALLGCAVGPLISGVIIEHLSWRWIYYVQTISCGLVVLALFAFFPETRGSVLLSRKAVALNAWAESVGASHPFGRVRWKVSDDEHRKTLGLLIKTSLIRPIYLLFTESVVFWFSLWMSFAWSILYLTFEVVPLIFKRSYEFSDQASGLVFTATAVASVAGTGAAILQERIVSNPNSWFSTLPLKGQPEARLAFACVQSLLLPVGLFWLGATAKPTIPWIVPTLSIGSITLGIFSVYLAVFNYLADTYHSYASSAIAAQSFTRNVFAAFLPLAAEPMLDSSLGIIGTGALLGGIGLLLSAVPWVLVIWGPLIRSRSHLSST
ncbi:MFS general substrate transporter [Xylaria nigripes]|nr:MFS general substrate transporter [Xylaria nigripes]